MTHHPRISAAAPGLCLAAALAAGWWAPISEARADDDDARARAARHFDRGEKLYAAGLYEEAVAAFIEANRLAAHRATLFNVARCYENMGEMARALRYYREALQTAGDEPKRADIERRIALLARRTVGVLVSSDPAGATVTVDARARPEQQKTPLLIKVTPGEHLLLVRRPGYQLAAVRVEVKLGGQQRVEVPLQRIASRTAAVACPAVEPCSSPPALVDARGLHLHLHVLSVIGLTSDQSLSAGPGIQLQATYRHLVFGGHWLLFMTDMRERAPVGLPGGDTYDRQGFRRWVVEAQFGWQQPWRAAYFYATASAGVIVDRAVFDGPGDDLVHEKFSMTWGLGGGMEIKVVRWLSFGWGVRFGMGHGDLINVDDPLGDAVDHHYPLVTLFASATFHL